MIKSEKELIETVSKIHKSIPSDSLLLFRGQTRLYDKVRSGRARPNAFVIPEVENGWNTIVNRISSEKKGTKYNQAILQHYGFPTFYLDLTKDPVIASWFACKEFKMEPFLWVGSTFRFQDKTTYENIDEGIGYLIIFEIPRYKELIKNNELFDIGHESKFIRPKKQKAFLMLDQPPRVPNPNQFIKTIIEIDRENFQSSKTTKELFPPPSIDKGYAELLNVPYVQMPSYYLYKKAENLESKNETESSESLDKNLVFGKRALEIPLYVDSKKDLAEFNPKWKDTIIYEPSPFRLWKTEELNISQIHEGQVGEFSDTAKITISPMAFNRLFQENNSQELSWPDINSQSIFFTKAVLDHDKVGDHMPPYVGIWLHKNNDLIIETHFIADQDKMTIELGHAFTLNNNRLEYVKIENECKCGEPELHKKVIEAFLKIHSMNSKGMVALVQHAWQIEKWYVLL
jgi:hypothetical protein